MSEMLQYVNLVREATTPLEILLNVDFLTDEFEKIEVKKEVAKAYGRVITSVERNFHEKKPTIDNKTLQMHRLWAILRRCKTNKMERFD